MIKNVSNCHENKSDIVKKRRVGIMGGTFDPIHIGHLILAEQAFFQYNLEKVLIMPSGNPPHKQQRKGRASNSQRLQMIQRAIADNSHFELSLVDMRKDEFSYTYHLLQQLNQEHPDTEYFFIIGADSLFSFDTWMEPEKICRECTLLVATRDHASEQQILDKITELTLKYNGKFQILGTPTMDISSGQLRKWISQGQSVRYFVPDSVIEYIEQNHIYNELES